MLSFDEFKQKLTSLTPSSGWLNAYVDRLGCFWIQGYGGMGTTIFKALDSAHPFVDYLETLLKDDAFEPQPFKYEYEAGEELARLLPNITVDPDVVFEDLDKTRESGELSRSIGCGAAKEILSHVHADENLTDDESIMSFIANSNRDIERAITKGEESARPFDDVVAGTVEQCKASGDDGVVIRNITDLLELEGRDANEFMDCADLMIAIREKYKHSDLSKSEFAERIGLTLSATEKLLSGHIEGFTAETLMGYLNKIS